MKKIQGTTNKQLSATSEKAAAANFKGRRQIASGALAFAKGDVKTEKYLIEDKVTRGASYTFTLAKWNKLRCEALSARKRPMFRITFGGKTVCVFEESEAMLLTADES